MDKQTEATSKRINNGSHMQLPLIDFAALESGTKPSVHEGAPCLHPRQSMAVACVEPDDLARFEGEGGLEAPEAANPQPEEWSAQ